MHQITPTVGRKVWFYSSAHQQHPIDATVIKVWGNGPDAAVNLNVVDPDTGAHAFVPSIRVGDELTMHPHYRWMPYQQGQAAAQGAPVRSADLVPPSWLTQQPAQGLSASQTQTKP